MTTFDTAYEEAKLTSANARIAVLQLSVMLGSGISITKTLESMAEAQQQEVRVFALGLFRGISRGLSLSEAMKQASSYLSRAQIALIKAGEETGRLPFVLKKLSLRMENDYRLRQQLFSALIYPVGILVVAGIMALFMTTYMLPELLNAAGNSLGPPPWPTRVLILLTDWSGTLTILLVASLASIPWLMSSVPMATNLRNWLLFRSPIVGTINREAEFARISGQLALLLYAGLNLDRALVLVATNDPSLEGALAEVLRGITGGSTLAEAFAETGEFSKQFVALVEVGEETGQLHRTLQRQADSQEEELLRTLDEATKLIEPLAMAVLGVVVGFVVIGCFLPIYQVISESL